MFSRAALLAALATVTGILPAAAQQPSQADRIREFRKMIRSSDEQERVDQIDAMARFDGREIAELLVGCFADGSPRVRARAAAILSAKTDDPTIAYLADEVLNAPKAEHRLGAAMALGLGRKPAHAEKLIARLQAEGDAEVARALCQALENLADRTATPALTARLGDRSAAVRIAAADALGASKDPAAVPALCSALADGDWRVISAVLRAHAAIRAKDSVGPLIAFMKTADARILEDTKMALAEITTNDFGFDPAAWDRWWQRAADTFEVPPPAAAVDNTKGERYGRSGHRYHTIETHSERLFFVVDISTSMLEPIPMKNIGKRTDKERKYSSNVKLTIAKEELTYVLRQMKPHTSFTIVAFETEVKYWKKELQPATQGNVDDACRWLAKLEPPRMSSGGMRPGGVPLAADGKPKGRTNTYAALRAAFGLVPEAKAVNTTGPPPKPPADTVFFLTDGEPTEGELVKDDDIIEEVLRWNRTGKVHLHTITMSKLDRGTAFLQRLATATGGQFVNLAE